jgi:hypothetical protein
MLADSPSQVAAILEGLPSKVGHNFSRIKTQDKETHGRGGCTTHAPAAGCCQPCRIAYTQKTHARPVKEVIDELMETVLTVLQGGQEALMEIYPTRLCNPDGIDRL